ncbi:ribbon-helix-helix protein, CopG family [Aeromicrobium sp. 179-A 4D2 NHS]|uniref:ribbon-helix-helix protein, CopG family n=1 Tax=Aeromicrobium sp. 179-A 4D2 NHS TaxID=3142375 RepID=UPI00399F4246
MIVRLTRMRKLSAGALGDTVSQIHVFFGEEVSRDTCVIRSSSYDLHVVADERIDEWPDEVEVGYDVEALKHRGRGRPGRRAEPMQVVAVRLTVEEIADLDAISERENLSRSKVIRRALASFAV